MTGFGKNVIPRRAHKERSQPAHRIARHGLLEKKQDYKKRAKHANRRAARLKLLREKAAFRNKDEFYHAMERGAPRKRRDVEQALASRDGEARLLVGTRDAGYVAVKHSAEAGKLRTLSKGLHFLGSACGKHTVYVSDDEDVREFVAPKDDKSELSMVGVAKQSKKQRKRAYSEFEARKERLRKLSSAAQDIATEKKLLGKGARHKVRDADLESGTPAVFKWRQQRKR